MRAPGAAHLSLVSASGTFQRPTLPSTQGPAKPAACLKGKTKDNLKPTQCPRAHPRPVAAESLHPELRPGSFPGPPGASLPCLVPLPTAALLARCSCLQSTGDNPQNAPRAGDQPPQFRPSRPCITLEREPVLAPTQNSPSRRPDTKNTRLIHTSGETRGRPCPLQPPRHRSRARQGARTMVLPTRGHGPDAVPEN